MTARAKATPLQLVAKHWTEEQRDPGAGRSHLGWAGMSLLGWRWVPGMSKVRCGRAQHRVVYLGTAPDGDLLGAHHAEGARRIVSCYSMGAAVDVLDPATGYLMLSLLSPHDHGFILPAPPCDGSAWEVRCIPMPEPLNGKLPLGVAVLAAAAERGGWGVR